MFGSKYDVLTYVAMTLWQYCTQTILMGKVWHWICCYCNLVAIFLIDHVHVYLQNNVWYWKLCFCNTVAIMHINHSCRAKSDFAKYVTATLWQYNVMFCTLNISAELSKYDIENYITATLWQQSTLVKVWNRLLFYTCNENSCTWMLLFVPCRPTAPYSLLWNKLRCTNIF